ncbi:MAG: hypothetical protein KDB33_10440 [Acidimicrobiales bacterium]|nr:hypothetical protein [Acidimicrobiales bacterium]
MAADYEPGRLVRIDAASGTVVADLQLGSCPTAVAVGFGSVWVADSSQGTVSRVDPTTNTCAGTVSVGENMMGLAVGASGVWVTDRSGDSVSMISPMSGEVVASFGVASGPHGIVVDGDRVWVAHMAAGPSSDQITEIDTRDGTVRRLDAHHTWGEIAAGFGSLWLADADHDGVRRVDPSDGGTEVVPVRRGPCSLVAGPRAVWVTCIYDQTLIGIDSATSATVDIAMPVGFSLAIASEDLWWVDYTFCTVSRIRGLKL